MPPHYFHYKKRLGQNFLVSNKIAERIIEFAEPGDFVVEIGAGKGILTKIIAQRARQVFAIEIDRNLASLLSNLNLKNVSVVNEDFLQLDLATFPDPIIIGNIPYSITTLILQKLVRERACFKKAVLTIQKEYGDRILAEPGTHEYGALTLFLNYYFSIKKGFIIPASCFSPKPKVNSVVIALNKKEPPFLLNDDDKFFDFLRGVFRYRRKSLKNAIRNHLKIVPTDIEPELLSKRPENLSLDDFHYLFKCLGLA